MKLKTSLVICMLSLGLAAGLRAQDAKSSTVAPAAKATPAAAVPSAVPAITVPAAPAYTEAQILETIGYISWMRNQLSQLEFTPAQVESLLKGMGVAAQGKECPYVLEKIGPSVGEYMSKKAAEMQKIAQERFETDKKKNTADGTAYFAKLKENKAVQFTPSGLGYEIVQPGSGANPKPTDIVSVNYTGKFIDGTVFDTNVRQGEASQPVEFPLNGVIPGWTEGLQKIAKGGKIRLHVPASLGYGDDSKSGMPPSSTLIFEVELLTIKTPPPPAPMPAGVAAPGAPAAKQ